jgi:hypothetical protein
MPIHVAIQHARKPPPSLRVAMNAPAVSNKFSLRGSKVEPLPQIVVNHPIRQTYRRKKQNRDHV